jgi:hypothetical protein
MTDIRRRLDQVVSKELARNIIPVKTAEGILVGPVLIVSEDTVKHLWRNGECLYKSISLNVAAIRIANLMAVYKTSVAADEIYREDQEYSKWFTDAGILRQKYYTALKNQDYNRADTLWARYCESKSKTETAKSRVIRLSAI